ncbi:MAG TPA: hypothetical protein PK544_08165 [Spirochaetota bacterium]|nr:hypothetical protein [Spirochaetota bacterium]HPQ53760.1 hypothetical protein [Spirochaetota bacterium]
MTGKRKNHVIHTRMNRSIFIIALLIITSLSCQSDLQQNAVAAPTESEQLALFNNTPQETLTPTKWDVGSTIISNEARLELYHPYIKDIGGGYISVGGTQNFILASWANSEWVWLMDFTRRVVAANKIHIAFLKHAKTPQEFRELWKRKSYKNVQKILKEEYSTLPEYQFIRQTWNVGRRFIPWRFGSLDRLVKKRNYKIWLNDQELYQRMRSLAQRGHIIAVRGNLNGPTTVLGIAETAKKMQVPIRVIYFSNAEEYMRTYSPQFRKNFSAIPVDDTSKVLRTISVYKWLFPWSPDSILSSEKGFHYNVMPAGVFQSWLVQTPGKLRVVDIMKKGEVNRKDGISVVNALPVVPEQTEKKIQPQTNK